jgi:flagellar biosynthesis protein FlhG
VILDTALCDQAAGLRSISAGAHSWTLAVTSGKGGVGKTSVAVNLALALAQAEMRTCLVDGDLGLANVDVLLNLHPRHTLQEVVAGRLTLDQIVLTGPAGLQVIPAASGVEALANLSPLARRALVDRLQNPSVGADVTILDTGAGLSRTVLSLVMAADEVLVVTTPEPTAMTDAYAMIKILHQRRPELAVQILVNQTDQATQARDVYEHLARIVKRFLGREVPLAGWVPRDACVERAVLEQRPLMLYFPFSRASEAIRDLARRVASRRGETRHGGFWARLVEAPDGGHNSTDEDK